jgi:aldehyde dehydrogenase (NAD+)
MSTLIHPGIHLEDLGLSSENPAGHDGLKAFTGSGSRQIDSFSPADGQLIGRVRAATASDYDQLVALAQEAFLTWRHVPAPKRGEIVRQIGDAFRRSKDQLGRLVSYEMGKIYQEGLGEVQEIIDICDFAVGLSRQLYGLTMPSERPGHRMFEQWHPLGPVGVISAFNFPVAVWAWNAMLAAVCGDTVIWKPSEKTPLCALACQHIISEVLAKNGVPAGVFTLVIGDAEIGRLMANDHRIPLVSATGSTQMGRSVAEATARRLGRSLLELGGNNAIIVSNHADLKLAMQATVFASVGTAGQRCTTARRLILHESIYDQFTDQLAGIYIQLQGRIGHPLVENTLIGPLIDQAAVDQMLQTLAEVQTEGGQILAGGHLATDKPSPLYVQPTLVAARNEYHCVQRETFAPILYVMKYRNFDEALAMQNAVPQGLSSSLFTLNQREQEQFLSVSGSDCGIANVNIGPSGAEIGGAFGGEKETGGGRESGSDSWKAYMRRQTVTINYSTDLPLAQGIRFDL